MQEAQGIRHTPRQMMADLTSQRATREMVIPNGISSGSRSQILDFQQRRGSSDISIAIPRFYDPLEYWDLSGLPWNMADEGHRNKLHKWARLFYATHYLVPILVDIFTRFPLAGMEMYCSDKSVEDFYTTVFLDNMQYEDFLVGFGREFWLVGEANALGSFDETLGVWEREELLNPSDIVVENFPFLDSRQLKVVPAEHLRRLAQTKQPAREYKLLKENFPNLIPYLERNEPFPVSDVLLKQTAFRLTPWDDRGTPILLRTLRTLIHEEKLLASQDAIAERMYSPLILAKLGYPPQQQSMGWLPSGEQLESFRDDMDAALSSDFRMMVYHYALEIQSVFGREMVPDLGGDFDRIERRLFQSFGINPSLLAGGAAGEPYASSALHAEFMNQMLRTYQSQLKRHFRQRALVVAEAQGHFEYIKKGQSRVPVVQRVVEIDSEGNRKVVERPKLMVPELRFSTLDLRDEATERQFLQSLRGMGVPISDRLLMGQVHFTYKDTLDEASEEMIQKTVTQQLAKYQTYQVLTRQGLPIPPQLKAEIEGDPSGGGEGMGGAPGGMGGPPPMGGGGGGMGAMPELGPGGLGDEAAVGPPPATPEDGGPAGNVPDVSTERMRGGPVMSSLSDDEVSRRISGMHKILSDIEESKKARTEPRPRTSKLIERDDRVIEDFVPPALSERIAALEAIEDVDFE